MWEGKVAAARAVLVAAKDLATGMWSARPVIFTIQLELPVERELHNVKDRNAPFAVRDIPAAKSVTFINALFSSGWAGDALHPVHKVHPLSV
jgi:hypothetical protein